MPIEERSDFFFAFFVFLSCVMIFNDVKQHFFTEINLHITTLFVPHHEYHNRDRSIIYISSHFTSFVCIQLSFYSF